MVLTAAQQSALDTQKSVWVTANAGTGKTRILTDRVIRLLIEGAAPENILSLTFTDAAAAEMKERILKQLAAFLEMSQEQLFEHLHDMLDQPPSTTQCSRAQQLFALVNDTPGSLQLMTIHSFCQKILQRFPIEAGVQPHFTIIDDQEKDELISEAWQLFFEAISVDETCDLARDYQMLTKQKSHFDIKQSVDELLNKRIEFLEALESFGNLVTWQDKVFSTHNIDPNLEPDTLLEQLVPNEKEALKKVGLYGKTLLQGTNKEKEKANSVLEWFYLDPEQQQQKSSIYIDFFLTTDLTPRKQLLTSKLAKNFSEIEDWARTEQQRILNALERFNTLTAAKFSAAFLSITHFIITRFQALKTVRGSYDFDDLIYYASHLLRQNESAEWIRYKMDAHIEHILVDEAQDTSLDQWQLIRAIAQDFFSGKGQHISNRTLFVVGDEKQSIYGFRGIDPNVFFEQKSGLYDHAPHSWKHISLDFSFRSTTPILKLVDQIFNNDSISNKVTADHKKIHHAISRQEDSGLVELWPLEVKAQPSKTSTSWSLPTLRESDEKAEHILANKIAKTIARWLAEKRPIYGKNREIQPRDICILVRSRSTLANAIVRALHLHHVPTTGIDRFSLTDHLGIKDLMALGQFVLNPHDDYNLACLLKSPLLQLNEEQIFELSYGRDEKSLWDIINEKSDSYFNELNKLNQFLAIYKTHTNCFDFYHHILHHRHAYHQLFSAFGHEVATPIEAWMTEAQKAQTHHTPNLFSFLQTMQQSKIEVKREGSSQQNAVKLLTIHSAKGLQAPVVFVPTTQNDRASNASVIWDKESKIPLYLGNKKNRANHCSIVKNKLEEHEHNESMRLLYVALTRAEDELYICGTGKENNKDDQSWHAIAKQHLQQLSECKSRADEDGNEVLYAAHGTLNLSAKTEATLRQKFITPTWLLTSPSFKAENDIKHIQKTETSTVSNDAQLRGTFLHQLLETLPVLPKEKRKEAAYKQLESFIDPHIIHDFEISLNHICSLIENHPHFFGPNSQAEVSIRGTIRAADGTNIRVSKQIDRLVVSNETVDIIEYKSGKAQTPIPQPYLHQLATYRSLIAKTHPKNTINCIILWIDDGIMMPVANELLPCYEGS